MKFYYTFFNYVQTEALTICSVKVDCMYTWLKKNTAVQVYDISQHYCAWFLKIFQLKLFLGTHRIHIK